jgi:predicted transcriptional regulator
MSSKDRTTSVKLDPEIRIRLGNLARVRRRSPHAIMKEAIARHVLREEMRLWEEYLDRHPTIAPEPALVKASGNLLPALIVGLPPHVKQQIAEGTHRLRAIRGWRGMSYARLITAIEDLGGAVGETALAAIEEGTLRPDAGLTVLLARALDVTVEDLTG